jgi:hypothetical protein
MPNRLSDRLPKGQLSIGIYDSFLMANSDDLEKMGIAIAERRRLGITVLPRI